MSKILHDLWSGIFGKLFFLVVGLVLSYIWAWWKRRCERQRLEKGRWDTKIQFVALFLHDDEEGNVKFHAERIGAWDISAIFKNEDALSMLVHSARGTSSVTSVVPMPGRLGSFVLNDLAAEVQKCRQDGAVREEWIMVPTYPTYAGNDTHVPTVVLIRPADLDRFASFTEAKDFQVRYSTEGGYILTAVEVYQKFQAQCRDYLESRNSGKSTTHLEEMWVVMAKIETTPYTPKQHLVQRGIGRHWKNVSWEKYAPDLKELGFVS